MVTKFENTGLYIYEIKICGTLDADWVAAYCPVDVKIVQDESNTTLSNIHADQSGIIGLIRSLHNSGYIILSFQIE